MYVCVFSGFVLRKASDLSWVARFCLFTLFYIGCIHQEPVFHSEKRTVLSAAISSSMSSVYFLLFSRLFWGFAVLVPRLPCLISCPGFSAFERFHANFAGQLYVLVTPYSNVGTFGVQLSLFVWRCLFCLECYLYICFSAFFVRQFLARHFQEKVIRLVEELHEDSENYFLRGQVWIITQKLRESGSGLFGAARFELSYRRFFDELRGCLRREKSCCWKSSTAEMGEKCNVTNFASS